jgi:lipopolysaccharide/colanic/teichoic acid biosynthesis glycosyltransferase
MTDWQHLEVDYKIAPEDSLSIIGSNSIHTRGDLYTVNINAVDKIANRRNKRLLDILLSVSLIPLSPVAIFLQKKPVGFFKNLLQVLFGMKSWVGYCPIDSKEVHLPKIRKGVLNPVNAMKTKVVDDETAIDLNILYARDYSIWKDLNIILYAFRDLGQAN